MGQFLAIGLATKLSVNKIEVDRAQLNIDKLQTEMKQSFHFDSKLYNASVNNELYEFTLKNSIFHTQLIPLLKTIYPLLYEKSAYYDTIISKLETMPPSDWFQWAKEKSEKAFQFDEYGMQDYIERHHNIRIHSDCLLLSMEGKIAMEVYGRQFLFFKYTMMQTFKPFNLAGALRVYITG